MSRPKSDFKIGDKVKHHKESKSEGVIVHRHSFAPTGKEWSVHWYKYSVARGIYSSEELKKYF
jgi:hypothetical protein